MGLPPVLWCFNKARLTWLIVYSLQQLYFYFFIDQGLDHSNARWREIFNINLSKIANLQRLCALNSHIVTLPANGDLEGKTFITIWKHYATLPLTASILYFSVTFTTNSCSKWFHKFVPEVHLCGSQICGPSTYMWFTNWYNNWYNWLHDSIYLCSCKYWLYISYVCISLLLHIISTHCGTFLGVFYQERSSPCCYWLGQCWCWLLLLRY